MRAKPVLILALFSGIAAKPLFSHDLAICLEVRAKLDSDTLQVLRQELQAIARSSGFTLRLLDQPSIITAQQCEDIRLTIRSLSHTEISALGAERVRDGRILPEIEVYASSVAALLPSTLPAVPGRGLARVAAHEIGHYMLRTATHSGELMSEYYTAPRLMVKDHHVVSDSIDGCPAGGARSWLAAACRPDTPMRISSP